MLKPSKYLVEVGLYDSVQAVYDAKYSGTLVVPYIRKGNRLLFDEEDIRSFIESSKVTVRSDDSGR